MQISTATLWCAALALTALVQVASARQASWHAEVAEAKARIETEVRALSTRLAQRRMAADLDAITSEKQWQLRESDNRAFLLVAEVYARGPEFTKCSSTLVSEKNQAFLAAYTTVAKCQIEAAKTLTALQLKAKAVLREIATAAGLTHCPFGDRVCLDKVVAAKIAKLRTFEEKKVKLGVKTALSSAESCMLPARTHVYEIVDRLAEELAECDEITAINFAQLPANRGFKTDMFKKVVHHYTKENPEKSQ